MKVDRINERGRPTTSSPSCPPLGGDASTSNRSSSARTSTPSPRGPGINDNGSGSATILEIAEQFAARGIDPEHGAVRVVRRRGVQPPRLDAYVNQLSAGGEGAHHGEPELRHGRLAELRPLRLRRRQLGVPGRPRRGRRARPARARSSRSSRTTSATRACLGPDAVQRPLGLRPVHRAGHPRRRPVHRRRGREDRAQAPIYGGTAGVAYDPCYHQACDTFANNNEQGLDEMSDATAHATTRTR